MRSKTLTISNGLHSGFHLLRSSCLIAKPCWLEHSPGNPWRLYHSPQFTSCRRGQLLVYFRYPHVPKASEFTESTEKNHYLQFWDGSFFMFLLSLLLQKTVCSTLTNRIWPAIHGDQYKPQTVPTSNLCLGFTASVRCLNQSCAPQNTLEHQEVGNTPLWRTSPLYSVWYGMPRNKDTQSQ